MEEREVGAADGARDEDEALSRTELQIEHEKLKLERERILLERDRLEAVRERARLEGGVRVGADGRAAVPLSTLALVSLVCLLVGGMLGSLTSSIHRDFRLQRVMRTLAENAPEAGAGTGGTNGTEVAAGELPPWLRTMKPKGAYSGISLVVIQ